MAFGKNETATHLWMCGSYHPVPFVTISSNMKDPSSHLGGLICSLAMGAGLSRLELQWWRHSLLFFFTQCQIKTVAQQLELIWIRLLWHFERRPNWKAFNFLSMTYCGWKSRGRTTLGYSCAYVWKQLSVQCACAWHEFSASPPSPPAVLFDPHSSLTLSKSSLFAFAQLRSANLHFLLQIWAWSHSVWASDSGFEADPCFSP